MRAPIGYYVHHQGDGHRQRALEIAAAVPERFVLLGTGLKGQTGDIACVDLEDDRPHKGDRFSGQDEAPVRPQALHYAPYHHAGVRARTARFAQWISDTKPALMVIDVSVEMAMLARLCATPVVYVRLAGDRSDPAHLDAFRGAEALLAPFHEQLDGMGAGEVRDKTHYFAPRRDSGLKRGSGVLVVHGRGGDPLDGAKLAAAAEATPEKMWNGVGPIEPPPVMPPNLKLAGWIDAIGDEIQKAEIIVGGAGDGLLNAVVSADKPFVCLPEPRAYNEQIAKAARLADLGSAVVLAQWPHAHEWPGILQSALALSPADRQQISGQGLGAAGPWLVDLASELEARR